MDTIATPPSDSISVISLKHPGLRFARAFGVGLGLFLLIWGPASWFRWNGALGLGLFQGIFIAIYAFLLLLPWNRLGRGRFWWVMYAVFGACSLSFVFYQVFDVLYQLALAQGAGYKSPPPAFQGVLIFLALMQLPTVLFAHKPELLD